MPKRLNAIQCFVLSICTFVVLASNKAVSADWPTVRQNPQRNAIVSEDVDAARLKLAWTYQGAGVPQTAWHGPAKWDAYASLADLHSMRDYDVAYNTIVVEDRVYFASSAENCVVCLNARRGNEEWRFYTNGPVRVAPTYWNGQLYFGSDDGYAYCIDAAGKLVWKFSPIDPEDKSALRLLPNNGNLIGLYPIRTGVVIDDGVAYFAASLLPWKPSYLCGVDANKGTKQFVREISGATFEGPLATSTQLLVAPQGRVAPALFSKVDGKPMGSLGGGGGAYVVVTNEQIVHGPGNKAGWMTESRSDTRERIATHKNARAVIVDGDVSFLLTATNLLAMKQNDKRPIWQAVVKDPCSMVAAKNVVFVGGVDMVVAYNSKSGKLLWEHTTEGRAESMSITNGSLYVSTDTGVIHAFNPTANAIRPREMVPDVQDQWKPKPPAKVAGGDLLGRWVFQRPLAKGVEVKPVDGKVAAVSQQPVSLTRIGDHEAVDLSGGGQSFQLADNYDGIELPKRDFTVAAWMRIDKTQSWGAVLSAIQDNGSYEHGLLLGYRSDKFCLGVAAEGGNGGLTYMTADKSIDVGRWHFVVGTYDGAQMRLYVDGKLVARSDTQQGDIDYADAGPVELAAYRDKDEYFPLVGAVHEVRLYGRALTANTIAREFASRIKDFPEPLSLPQATSEAQFLPSIGPYAQFTAPGKVAVRWKTKKAMPTIIEYMEHGTTTPVRLVNEEPELVHQVMLSDLKYNRVYKYRVVTGETPNSETSQWFECDTFFDYSPHMTWLGKSPKKTPAASIAKANSLIEKLEIDRGLCLVYNVGDADLLAALVTESALRLHVVMDDVDETARLRQVLTDRGVIARATVYSREWIESHSVTPYIASGIIVGPSAKGVAKQMIERQLAPRRTAIVMGSLDTPPGNWQKLAGKPIAGSGEWTHAYGQSNNAAYANERLAGVDTIDQLDVQWLGRPGPRYQSDRGNRNPPPIASNGRLFVQGLERMIAVDQYNGTILWSLEIPAMRRFNIPRDCSNWCADDDFLYTAVRDKVWKIDAATGRPRLFDVPNPPKGEKYDWGYLASEGDKLIGSAVRAGSSFTEFWGPSKWYDAVGGPDAAKVVSDKLFAVSKADGYEFWDYKGGLVNNATITISDGSVMFVESGNTQLQSASERRIESADLFSEQTLVALDVETGKKLWEKKLTGMKGTTMLNMSASGGVAVLVASYPKQFDIAAFDMATGVQLWQTTTPWPNGRSDHGVHLARPAIVGQRLFLRPTVLDLKTGKILPQKFPVGGCGTYACSDNALMFRSGSGGMLSMWSSEDSTYSHFPRLRPNCWLSSIPAGGLLLSPEAGGGCSCGKWMETSLAFIPKVHLQPAKNPEQ